jgi:nucleoside-diphosphate-sugar epimerase
LVLGAAGMLGHRLVERLARDGTLGPAPIHQVTLADIVEPKKPSSPAFDIETVVADIAVPKAADGLLSTRPDVVFHLAAVVSGEAEADFERGYRVNLEGTRQLLEAARAIGEGYRPRIVFASSIAVFGAPLPDVIGDNQCATPLTSYGTQKAIAELLLCDYTRRGFVDGVGVRLPTICVRPGAPNQAVSGFFSSIIREPLNGDVAVLPVSTSVRHWHASPRAAVGFFVHAARIDGDALGDRRCLTMPGVSVTVAEQIEALRAVGGDEVIRLIRSEPDERVMRIVSGWPRRFDAQRALDLGFRADESFARIVRVHIEDELGGRIATIAS